MGPISSLISSSNLRCRPYAFFPNLCAHSVPIIYSSTLAQSECLVFIVSPTVLHLLLRSMMPASLTAERKIRTCIGSRGHTYTTSCATCDLHLRRVIIKPCPEPMHSWQYVPRECILHDETSQSIQGLSMKLPIPSIYIYIALKNRSVRHSVIHVIL